MLSNRLELSKQQRRKGEKKQDRANQGFSLLLYFPLRWLLLFPVVSLICLGIGCSGRAVICQRGVLEEQFDPLSLQDDDIWEELKKPAPAVSETASATPSSPAVPDTSQREGPKYVQGFRVQIFASPDRERAVQAQERAEMILEEDVYLEFEAPYYKVRVGDCGSAAQAEKLLEKLRKKGYHDAFRVRTTIQLQPDR
ncbi:MAG: hypothetical protein DRQ02_06635 [Candidatus Latescibacterota bacterium]|nr:MAG: hypothetical protein DRQ02_06635 [Candidatus Latescibacterota bacterium]RKY73744.1 MAG: hypothetical protein DRQ24_01605 [Candidatus Latescibacterota bacterium]